MSAKLPLGCSTIRRLRKSPEVAHERELVLVAAARLEAGFDLARIREPHARLAQKIEADVGLRDVLFEDRPVADPFAQTLREDERRIAEAQQVLEELLVASHGDAA